MSKNIAPSPGEGPVVLRALPQWGEGNNNSQSHWNFEECTKSPSPLTGEGRVRVKLNSRHRIFTKELRERQTEAEKLIWFKLRDRKLINAKFRRQVSIDNRFIVDFVCFEHRLIIELDGGQHNWHKNQEYDKNRTGYLIQKGFKVIRYWDNEVLNHIDEVLEEIIRYLPPHPNPLPQGEREIISDVKADFELTLSLDGRGQGEGEQL